jgi:hypothetical protein
VLNSKVLTPHEKVAFGAGESEELLLRVAVPKLHNANSEDANSEAQKEHFNN